MTYLYNVLTRNYPRSRSLWDLLHYFFSGGEEIDLQFDVSFFLDSPFKNYLSSFRSAEFSGLKPTLAMNILSKSTWRKDVLDHVEMCRMVEIPLYLVYTPYDLSPRILPAPLLRVYVRQPDGTFEIRELTRATLSSKDTEIHPEAVLDADSALPYVFGLEEIEKRYAGGKAVYQCILIDRTTNKKLRTATESAIKIAVEEKDRTEIEKKRADAEKKRADLLEKELNQLKSSK